MAKIEAKKRATAIPAGLEITPSDGYDAMLEVILAAEPNFKPENIMAGIEVWGKIGTATPTESNNNSGFYPNDDKDDPDEPYDPDKPGNTKVPNKIIEEETGQSADTFDVMILQNGTGDVTYGFLEKGLWDYNGTVLPALPEWDKETYPYALIVEASDGFVGEEPNGMFNLFFCKLEQSVRQYDGKIFIAMDDGGTNGIVQYYKYNPTSDTGWVSHGELYVLGYYPALVWTNYDIRFVHTEDVYMSASDPIEHPAFEITWYDPATTNFKAKGWRRLSYHRQGDYWQSDDFTTVESGGWNYLKNITECTREKLYYMGVEVWPNMSQTWSYNGTVLPALPAWDRKTYPYAAIVRDTRSNANGVYADSYCVVLSKVPGVWNDVVLQLYAYGVSNYLERSINLLVGENEWGELRNPRWDYEDIPLASAYAQVVWANHDILTKTTGEIYFHASNPTPV